MRKRYSDWIGRPVYYSGFDGQTYIGRVRDRRDHGTHDRRMERSATGYVEILRGGRNCDGLRMSYLLIPHG